MNIRKATDYSTMYSALNQLMAEKLPQVELYFEIGWAVSARAEKGAAVAASEYLQAAYPDATAGLGRKTGTPCDFSTFQVCALLIYTTLTPKSTTWSPDKSPRSGRYRRSDLGLSFALWPLAYLSSEVYRLMAERPQITLDRTLLFNYNLYTS